MRDTRRLQRSTLAATKHIAQIALLLKQSGIRNTPTLDVLRVWTRNHLFLLTMRRRKTKRRGGKLVSDGTNAKIFYPAIPCKDGRDMTRKVSRVLKKEYQSKDRLLNKKLYTILKGIDPNQNYFIYPESCEAGELTLDNKDDGITDSDKTFSEFMTKGKETWREYQRHSKPTEKQEKHLLKAIQLLHEAKVMHGDLNGRNMVISEDDGLPRIIDFGAVLLNAPAEIIKYEQDYVDKHAPIFGYAYNDLRALHKQIYKHKPKVKYTSDILDKK